MQATFLPGRFDSDEWAREFKSPTWYLRFVPEWQKLQEEAEKLPQDEKERLKALVYSFIEKMLSGGRITLGNEKGLWDKERQNIDTIIIHHTSSSPGMTPIKLSAIELIRLYAPYYVDNSKNTSIVGHPISSGHVRRNQQVFWPYHWIIRQNGATRRLLNDSETGWQAGNWEINCRSVAIAFDNDYTNSRPSTVELQAVAKIIERHYPTVEKQNIFGHREVNPKTECPSNLFLGPNGWKNDLLSLI